MTQAPDWFTQALAVRPRERFVQAPGCRIHVSEWGDPRAPALVLVHGGGAHTHWWDFIAPFLSGRNARAGARPAPG